MRYEVQEAVRYIFSDEIEAEKARLENEIGAEKQKAEKATAELERLKKEIEAELEKTVKNMLLEKLSLSTISKCTNASLEMVVRIAKSLGMESLPL